MAKNMAGSQASADANNLENLVAGFSPSDHSTLFAVAI